MSDLVVQIVYPSWLFPDVFYVDFKASRQQYYWISLSDLLQVQAVFCQSNIYQQVAGQVYYLLHKGNLHLDLTFLI